MPKLSVCVEMVFSDRPFLERLDAVAAAGLGAVEFWRLQGKDVGAIARRAAALGLQVAAFVGMERASLVDAARRAEARQNMERAARLAGELGAPTLILTTGNTLPGVERAAQGAVLLDNLKQAAEIGERHGVTFALEPLNTRVDHPGYFLERTEDAAFFVEAVGSPRLGLLYDIYHQQVSEGDLIATIRRHAHLIAHYHAAAVPGRGELDEGEIAYSKVAAAIDATGYAGYLGLEFMPGGDHLQGLLRSVRVLQP